MGKLLSGLRQILGESVGGDGSAPAMHVRVKCAACGEIIPVRIDKANDLLCEFAEEDEPGDQPPRALGYALHKEVVGRRCQNLVRFTIEFDERRRITRREIEGGEFVECEDCE